MKELEGSRKANENVVKRGLDFLGGVEWGSGQSDLHPNGREHPADTLLTYTLPHHHLLYENFSDLFQVAISLVLHIFTSFGKILTLLCPYYSYLSVCIP